MLKLLTLCALTGLLSWCPPVATPDERVSEHAQDWAADHPLPYAPIAVMCKKLVKPTASTECRVYTQSGPAHRLRCSVTRCRFVKSTWDLSEWP